jgi:hypothetical protein
MPAERTFLHDLASPLASALLMLESARDCLGAENLEPEEALKCVVRTSEVMAKMREMLEARWKVLNREETP